MKRVLIVDDNADGRESLRVLLELSGYEAATAGDGAQALDMMRAAPADVVVTDIFMPTKDGVETIVAIRKEFPSVPIIAMSGAASYTVDYLSVARELGAERILRKPFETQQLLDTLKQVLG
jgi:CheY-like chemotaxis protein